jgi:ribosomal protein S18 acetylase RimI-like enzyme
MNISARAATPSDIDDLVVLYRALAAEQSALRHMWPLADGLPEPVETAFEEILSDPESFLVVCELDDVPLGFAWARVSDLLPQAGGERVAVVRLIHTEEDARGVGIGEAMMDVIFDRFRPAGITKFDAVVSPGHRNAKNFFESQGFKARRITMNLDDDPPERSTLPGGMTRAEAVRGTGP